MKHPKQLWRLFYIYYVIYHRGLDDALLSSKRLSAWRFLRYFNPWNWRRPQSHTRGVSIRLALEDLGPIFIKFGQVLSTRPDLIPADILVELEKLQDQVPPFAGEQAVQILEKTYGSPIHALFQTFSTQPLASASIAQVHEATLLDGRQVVVKIRRPGIGRIITRDLALLYTIARLAERFWSHGKRLRAVDLVKELDQVLQDEQDFMVEAANAAQLRRNFEHSPLLYVPQIIWEFSHAHVMVIEKIRGISISDITALKAAGIDFRVLAERGVEIFFTQVLRDSFFHADMHPGNIFVSPDHPHSPQYIAVDFGIIGVLSPQDQHYLAENLLAFFRRDYRRVAILHIESGWVPRDTRVEALESAIRTVCEPIFARPLRDISFAQLLLRLFQTASRFKMQVQPQLFLLQKTLFNIEGLGRKLYPDLDLWETAKPFLERALRRRYQMRRLFKQTLERTPALLDNLTAIPALWRQTLEQVQHASAQREAVESVAQRMNFWRGLSFGVIGAVVLVGIALILWFHT